MPKEKRRRSGAHEQSVRLHKRQFAEQDNAVEHVEIGEQSEKTAPEILADMEVEDEARPALKKKEKQALKHELFLKRPSSISLIPSTSLPSLTQLSSPRRPGAISVALFKIPRTSPETQGKGAGRRRHGRHQGRDLCCGGGHPCGRQELYRRREWDRRDRGPQSEAQT
ncbi:hypothetical protein ONZ51_g7182 [Trametes cubensis]|uniref:Uncharacterized protein n=1 Tax=Trametes cubensis TaxID=1111947 RepID=A0AAD7TQZ8_9APHY|nr:hypothetical protein ONZ51_g7182 [Trametes cubensis]